MEENIEIYEQFIKEILRKLPIVHINQLLISLIKSFDGMDKKRAVSILKAIQKHGQVLLSPNDWAMTKGAYKTLTNDRFYDGVVLNSDIRLPEILNIYDKKSIKNENGYTVEKRGVIETKNVEDLLEKSYLNKLDAFWLVADMFPDSKDFFIGDYPFTILFNKNPDENDTGMLYEIINIPKNNYSLHCEMLKKIPSITDTDMRNSIRRIAIIEDESYVEEIPNVGISHICMIDHNENCHYKVIEKREKGGRWNYYE